MTRAVAVVFAATLVCSTARCEDRPIVMHQVDLKTGRQSGGLTDAQVDEIVRFVKTLPGVNHHVQEVDGTEPPQVLVHTGRHRSGSGDLLRTEKRHGHWVLLRKSKWELVVEQSKKKGVPPFVYEKEQ